MCKKTIRRRLKVFPSQDVAPLSQPHSYMERILMEIHHHLLPARSWGDQGWMRGGWGGAKARTVWETVGLQGGLQVEGQAILPETKCVNNNNLFY